MTRGTTVRYARRSAATATIATSARHAGSRIPARRATVVVAISRWCWLFDAERGVPERLVLVEVGPQREADVEDRREVVEVGVLRRHLRVRRNATGRLDRLLSLARGEPLHEELTGVRMRWLVREGHALHVGDDRIRLTPDDRLVLLVPQLRETVAVRGERRRELAGREEVRHVGVAAAQRRLVRRDALEDVLRLGVAQDLAQRRVDDDVALLDGDLPGKRRVAEVLPGLDRHARGQLRRVDARDVVVEPRGAEGAARVLDLSRVVSRRSDDVFLGIALVDDVADLEELRLHDVEQVLAGLLFRHDFGREDLTRRASVLDLDAGELRLEQREHLLRVVGVHR